jgi:hypothetical protein
MQVKPERLPVVAGKSGVPKRFLAYLMTYRTLEDILAAKKNFFDGDFAADLRDPAPGIFDRRSWVYWNSLYGFDPVPPLSKRTVPG